MSVRLSIRRSGVCGQDVWTDLHQIWYIASLYHTEEKIFKQFDLK